MIAAPAARLGDAIAQSAIAVAMRESTWAYPVVETVHIIGFSILVGSILVVDLRLLGWRRQSMLGSFVRSVLPVTLLSTLLVVPTGVLLFVAHANDLVGNVAFVTKMLLLFAAATNAAMFHVGPYRAELEMPVGAPPRASTRWFASVSIALWLSIITMGRWIAYV